MVAGLPTAISLSSTDDQLAEDFANKLHCAKTFRVYRNNDFIGIQLGGAVKNVIAIGAGLADGLGFGSNARTALITRGLAELTRLGIKLGAQPQTFMGMAGLGDLVLTCTDNQSRNRRFGLEGARALNKLWQKSAKLLRATKILKKLKSYQPESGLNCRYANRYIKCSIRTNPPKRQPWPY